MAQGLSWSAKHELTARRDQSHSMTYFGLSGVKSAGFLTNLKLRCKIIVNIPLHMKVLSVVLENGQDGGKEILRGAGGGG